MAAAGSAKSNGPGLRSRNKSNPLSLDEARCPVCSEVLVEPVTMPCGHSVCLQCFQRTVRLASLCCPLCRRRVSSWARKRSREKSLVDAELWELVRRSHPERCRRRLEQREREPAHGEVFRLPEPYLKSGDKRQEYEKQKVKIVSSEDTDECKKRFHRKEECELLNLCLQHPFDAMSDSENEEPVGKRTRHVSAFVRKTRCSPAFSRSCPQSTAVQRSRSCTDSEDGRRKTRGRTNQTLPEKAAITYSFNAGILLSSENSRSFSAPVLSIDKRWRGIHTSSTSLGFQSKLERSISPESNDSISEELNHFKPIVCSPCTPPKRLPDGRLLEPTIVKSTPRNLTRNLQKATSYEASPTILQKWKQIEVDRQSIKVMSKGTVTSPFVEDLNLKLVSVEEQDQRLCPVAKHGRMDLNSICSLRNDLPKGSTDKPLFCNKRRLLFDQHLEEGLQPAKVGVRTFVAASAFTEQRNSKNVCEPKELCPPILDLHSGDCNQGADDFEETLDEPTTMNFVFNRPTSRRSKKRSHKTKHLEENIQSKLSRMDDCDGIDNLIFQRINQEKDDRELAVKLQRQFDRENKILERNKAINKYELRSWTTKDGMLGRYARRSGRASKRCQHFNHSC
ncbi:hypothetical protein DNTS_006338 [Danionella cerebrum]|uniref:RING-type E3 ubiquitin transferase n=1 Tax=Danionella cerebrum TaxID=2873325 RepID=A0A553Q5C4_9TELE|nr:hypothetical protein DNTS_006338 [Danionella translucida]